MQELYRVARRFVLMKVSYLTKRPAPLRWILGERSSYIRRNREEFINHWYDLGELKEWIRVDLEPRKLTVTTFLSRQLNSWYQAILLIEKA